MLPLFYIEESPHEQDQAAKPKLGAPLASDKAGIRPKLEAPLTSDKAGIRQIIDYNILN